MGQYGRIPDPFDALRKLAPRTGPPVQNMGGTPTLPPSPAAKTVVPSPAVATGPPGPQGQALPAAPPLTLPPPPPGYQAPQQAGQQGAVQQPAAPTVVKKTETTTTPAPALGPNAMQSPAPQPAAPGGPYQVIGTRPQMPTEDELMGLGTGHGITTPHGDVFRDHTGALKLRLNDAGKQAYEEERARKLGTFGAYPGHDDPTAPPPPLTPGLPSFNPFTGQWSD